ncbi:TPA: hypothetical protein N0F65_004533 [Lagenidium giganteum]|uniref:PX domain-containing protein n=1 Tax=Lagenidium giganteum TaxID=4803 RepID=A0AAV2YW31_9STRA|nr:TPA: hypothetical protein N0F65_004533 [Lagenidium giganteum]
MSRLVVSIGHVEFTVANQTLYVIKVQQDNDEWEVRRTYSDFRRLRDDVQRAMKDDKHQVLDDDCSREFAHAVQELFFPAKRIFGSKKDRVVKERAVDLHHFLIKLLFLTHTYRKAQKALYEHRAMERPQASVGIFYLLRDFLKPLTVKAHSNAQGDLGLDAHEDDEAMRRMIRESKMLSMRTSQQQVSDLPPPPDGQHDANANGNGMHRINSNRSASAAAAPAPAPAPAPVGSKTLKISSLGAKSPLTLSPATLGSNMAAGSPATASDQVPEFVKLSISPTEHSPQELAFVHATTAMPSSEKTRVRKKKKHRSKDKEKGKEHKSKEHRSKKSSSHPPKSKEQRDSDRLSRLTPQLTAQSISIEAQKELERYLSEYNAIMILRYVDRFISKAVTKAPGCYTVTSDNRLMIDSERFLEEIEVTFSDLPSDFDQNFKNASGDWMFPRALDAYVQLKWNSFQGKSSLESPSVLKSSDDEGSDSDYEYQQVGGGYMKSKRDFTQEEADVLQEMIANGTAGRDQVLRLRRQMNEQGWNRRENPGAHDGADDVEEYWTDTDDDEARNTNSSGSSSSVERYSHRNVLNKRLSRRNEIGGLV